MWAVAKADWWGLWAVKTADTMAGHWAVAMEYVWAVRSVDSWADKTVELTELCWAGHSAELWELLWAAWRGF